MYKRGATAKNYASDADANRGGSRIPIYDGTEPFCVIANDTKVS